jgi:hypothetical protein
MVRRPAVSWRAAGRGVAGGAAALAALAAAMLHAAGAAAAGGQPAPPPAPQAGANVRMNAPQLTMPAGRLGRAAEAIVADRTGNLLVTAWETMQGTCGPPFGAACTPPKTPGITAVGTSTDGGRTWTEAGAPYLGGNAMTAGHPWLDRGGADDQTFFLTSRAMDARPAPKEGTPGGAGQLGILFFRGRFAAGALTWSDQHLFTPRRPDDILRAPSLLAAKDGSGRVFVAVSALLGICGHRGNTGGEISVFRSADEGRTWEGPVIVSPDDFLVTADPKDPLCGSRGTIQISTSMAMGTRGEVYLTWQGGPKLLRYTPDAVLNHTTGIRFARSLDGGRTFSEPRDLVTANSLRNDPPVGWSKVDANDFPRLAVAAGGHHRGRLYVAWASALHETPGSESQQVLDSSQVYLIHSDDQGATWSAPLPLGPPPPPAGVKRFWPTVAVRQDGEVDVVYVEEQEKQLTADPDDVECDVLTVYGLRRKGKVSSLIDLYRVSSGDGGTTFGSPIRVTSETTNWCKVSYHSQGTQFANFGDYLGIFSTANRTFVVWPDGRNGVPDAYFAELAGGGARPDARR